MPYYIGGEITDRHKLNVQTPATLKAKLNLDVRTLSEVLAIDVAAKTVSVRELRTGKEYSEPYDELVLSVGAKPFLPPIPGIDRPGNLALRNLDDMDRIVSWVSGGEGGKTPAKTAVVAGGGFIGGACVRTRRARPPTARSRLPALARLPSRARARLTVRDIRTARRPRQSRWPSSCTSRASR